jgi:hypothetical protein
MTPIPDFPDYYITNQGTVVSKKYNKYRELKPNLQGGGYVQVILQKDSKPYARTIHQLVAQSFLTNPDNLPCVCHKNDIRTDNRVENLFWGSYQDNINDMVKKGRQAHGSMQGLSKLTDTDVLYIRAYPKFHGSQKKLSIEFNVHPTLISKIINNTSLWKHLL